MAAATTAPTVIEKSPVVSSARQIMVTGAPSTPVPKAAMPAIAAVPGWITPWGTSAAAAPV